MRSPSVTSLACGRHGGSIEGKGDRAERPRKKQAASQEHLVQVRPRLSCVGVQVFAHGLAQHHALGPVVAQLTQAALAHKAAHPDEDFALLHHRESTIFHRFEALFFAPLVGIDRLSELGIREHPLQTLIGHGYQSATLRQCLGQRERVDAAESLMPVLGAHEAGPIISVERFSRVENVPVLNGSRLQVPDQPGEFFGLADGRPEFLTSPTHTLLRKDGGAWHFSKTGHLVATEQNGSRVVYERDEQGRLTRIVGWLGGQPVAFIALRYDRAGRIESAHTSGVKRETAIRYEYNDAGRLSGVVSASSRFGYRYEGPWVAAVTHSVTGSERTKADETIVRRFEYGPRGQLLAEVDAHGAKTTYHVTSDAGRRSVTVVYPGSTAQSDVIQYDQHLRSVDARYAEGTRIWWHYPMTGGVVMDVTAPDGQKIRLTEAPDRRSRTLQLNQHRQFTADYDAAGRLTSLADTGRTLLRQEWYPDGRLRIASNARSTAHCEYGPDGLMSRVLLAPSGERGQFKHWQATTLDPAGRPREITDYRGLQVLLEYSSSGELATIGTKRDDKHYGLQITRDTSGRVQEVRSSWGTQRYSYDAGGLLMRLAVETAGGKSLVEWQSGLLQKVRQFDGGEFFLTHHESGKYAGLPKRITAPNRLALSYEYDESNQLSQVAVGSAYQLVLDYDARGRLVGWHYIASKRQ